MDYLPLFVRVAGARCVLVGGGEVAHRRLLTLLSAGARVTIVAPQVIDAVRALCVGDVELVERSFEPDDVVGAMLVVAAAGDDLVNREVHAAAVRSGVLVNAVDDAARSTAIFPAIVDRDPVIIAVSTGGRSPTLARRVRTWIEARLPTGFANAATVLGRWRSRVGDRIDDVGLRRRFWDAVLDDPSARSIYEGDAARADASVAEHLQRWGEGPSGFVSLVGAGPGDPALLTLKALQCLERADVVFYDNLVSKGVLDLARRDARRVYVGKRRAFQAVRQESINAMLIEAARAGERVVRLKGGDPFIFGRGGEEIETLAQHGVHFEVVPGITAALGCASYAHIPLTHRDWAQSVRFVTGNRSGDRVNLDWPELAKPDQTLVIYMGLRGLPEICRELVAHGMDPQTPAALVARGTLPDQQVIVAALSALAEAVRDADPHGPTTVIVGRVVSLRGRLDTVASAEAMRRF
jgi:uroporphyrin-III C-methyltransferase/precorrin-2 dehydrogenase/sirohydrochlorin ferrochelatase